jgi:hypothetical protein
MRRKEEEEGRTWWELEGGGRKEEREEEVENEMKRDETSSLPRILSSTFLPLSVFLLSSCVDVALNVCSKLEMSFYAPGHGLSNELKWGQWGGGPAIVSIARKGSFFVFLVFFEKMLKVLLSI